MANLTSEKSLVEIFSGQKPLLRPSQDEIKNNLFWAGRNLLVVSVRLSSGSPKLKSSSIFSNYCQEDIFKFSARPIKIFPPTPQDIDKIDNILEVINLISDPLTRRILQARCLIDPISHQHIFTYAKISRLLSISPDLIKKRFFRGLDEIKYSLNVTSWKKIRKDNL